MILVNNKIRLLALMIGVSCSITSCNDDFFDAQPDNLLNIKSIFSNRVQTENYWGALYAEIPDIWSQPYNFYYSAITDEIDASNWVDGNLDNFNSGAISSDNVPNPYLLQYRKIRQCGIFINNVDNCLELKQAENGQLLIKQYKAEAKFLRAYYYWAAMKTLGPITILPLNSDEDSGNFQIARSSWDECVAFILKEMEEAAVDMPEDYDDTQMGRINKMIVEAVKSEITLFSASPLYNGNAALSNWKNLDGKQLINPQFDAGKWKVAADQAKAAIEIAERNGKALFVKEGADQFTSGFLSTRDVFWDGYRTEGIWIRSVSDRYQWESSAAPRAIAGTPYNGIGVVQELVDDFRMANGETIGASNTYNENTYVKDRSAYFAAGTNTMYTNREPRFYAYITFNGSMVPGEPKAGINRVEFYASGNSGKNGAPRDWPKTGYTARKNIHPTFSFYPEVAVARPAMLIRLSELYLNYAEALNEHQPGHADILTYLNAVRTRAGLPKIATGLSQEQMREEIRKERRVELCFEGKRFFDVRRWKMVDKKGYQQGGNFHGMDMSKGNSLSSPDFHKRIVAIKRAPWNDRYYFLPWGQAEIDRNKQLVQAPGY